MEEEQKIYKIAEDILYNVWFTVAQKIFKEVVKVTNLTDEQATALKSVALRPNDFQIEFS
jgi:hypothetical protein